MASILAPPPSGLRGSQKSPQKVSEEIDAYFDQAWREAGVEPAPLADDATFLRRVYLDLTGVIPTIHQTRRFLADPSNEKRDLLIRRLLNTPEHAAHLARMWRDIMLPRGNNAAPLANTTPFEQWLRENFAQNTPYHRLAAKLLQTTGRADQNGAALFFTSLELKPEKLAASTSRVFLGVQIQCAQCHDHPFQAWTQEDFWSYAAFFAHIQRSGRGLAAIRAGAVVERRSGEVRMPGGGVVAPRFLGEKEPAKIGAAARREVLAGWLASDRNPYFARAAVNRVWAMLFGVGLVDPVDDLGKHNPPRHPKVLDLVAADLVAHGYDLRRLFQMLAGSKLYQRVSGPAQESDAASGLFRTMALKSLTAEQIYACLITASCRRDKAPGDTRRLREKREFLARFEAPTQKATEFQAGIPQELTLLNGALLAKVTHPVKSDLLAALADSPFMTDGERVETLFLASLSRPPRAEEKKRFEQYVRRRGENGRRAALSDIFWALLNSSEFLLNH